MIVILIRWFIKKNTVEEFIEKWKNILQIPAGEGLYREILTTPDVLDTDPRLHTFSLENPHYTTFINVGIWRSVADFERMVGSKYIPNIQEENGRKYIEIFDFEFKPRERIILDVVSDRGTDLPPANLTK